MKIRIYERDCKPQQTIWSLLRTIAHELYHARKGAKRAAKNKENPGHDPGTKNRSAEDAVADSRETAAMNSIRSEMSKEERDRVTNDDEKWREEEEKNRKYENRTGESRPDQRVVTPRNHR